MMNIKKKVTERLTKLNLTKLTRPTPVEAFYDEVVYFQHRKDSLLDSIRILTSIKTADGTILGIGEFDVEGMSMHRCWPEEVDFKTGACVCRY